MPSGAKKRKAARRKKEMCAHQHPPDSPTNSTHVQGPLVPGNGESRVDGRVQHEAKESESSSDHPLTDEEAEENKNQQKAGTCTAGSENIVAKGVMEGSANGKGEGSEGPAGPLKPEEVVEEIVLVKEEMVAVEEPPPAAEDVRVEYAEAEKVEKGSRVEEELPVAVDPSAFAVAQSAPVTEEVVQASEVRVEAVEALTEALSQESEMRAAGERPREVAVTTEAAAPAPLLVHRATWWNCCGLLDVFLGSQR